MKFENPNVLWALLLLAIPILIHLFHFKKYKTLYFSSLIFIKQVEQETQSVKKLKHLLILCCRLLAFCGLVLAFAKPYFPLESGSVDTHTNAIYIDNSFSMTNLGTNGQLFEIAKEQARNIVQRMGNDESFYIITNTQSPIEQKKYSKAEAIERINEIHITPISKNFTETANWLQVQLEKNENEQLDRFIYLSDFQNDTIQKPILLDKKTQFYPIQLIAQKKKNIAIDSVWFTNPNFRVGSVNELNVIVHNYGNQNTGNIAIQLKTNQTQRDIFISIPAEDTLHVTINYSDQQDGWVKGNVSLLDEGILFDDEMYFSYLVQKSSRVVIIDGEDAVSNVQAVFETESYYQVQTVNSKSIDNFAIQRANTIILNGLNSFSSGLIDQLTGKAKEGSSILILPGTHLNLQEANALLAQLKLTSIRNLTEEKFRITTVNTNDYFFKGVFSKTSKNLTLPTYFKHYQVNNSSNFLPLLKLENGDPAFIRSVFFSTYLLTSPLKNTFSNTVSDPIFSTILLKAGEMSGEKKPIYLTIGEHKSYPIRQENPETPIQLQTDKYEFIPQKTFDGNKSILTVQTLDMSSIVSGWYAIREKENQLGYLSLNYNRKESSLNYTSMDEIESAISQQGFKNLQTHLLNDSTHLSLVNTENKKEYWKLLLILALSFFIIEMMLIKFWK